MLERYHNIGGHLRLDPEGTLTSYADAQATIADLRGQVEANKSEYLDVIDVQSQEIAALQQRVAQLEGEREVLLHKQAKMFEYQCPKAPPSCLMCGNVEEFAIKHLEFGSVGICKACADLQADHARVLGALRNCHITARRALASKTADLSRMVLMFEHIKRYCEEAGIEQGGVLRAASLPAPPAQGIIDRMAHINDGCECRICKPQPAQGGVES